jgi:hypothetical protein
MLVHEQEVAAVLVAMRWWWHSLLIMRTSATRELLAALHRAFGHPLDGHLQTKLLEEAPIHRAEPALPELAVLSKVPCHHRKFAVLEPHRAALDNEFISELIILTSDNDPDKTTVVSSLRSMVEVNVGDVGQRSTEIPMAKLILAYRILTNFRSAIRIAAHLHLFCINEGML